VHNYDAQQHTAGQIISPLTLQTITTAQMLSVGGEGERWCKTLTLYFSTTCHKKHSLDVYLMVPGIVRLKTTADNILFTAFIFQQKT